MQKNLKVGSTIKTKLGDGLITKIGDVHYNAESHGVGWAMLTVTIPSIGTAYAPARADELAHDD